MRWLVVSRFNQALEHLALSPSKIAIIGGSSGDPEVTLLTKLYPNANVTYLGIDNYGGEDSWLYLDLNKTATINYKYDLVVCSQVLEHIWDVSNALDLITELAKPNGFIWLNCPASNIAHGSPEFYSAGYSPDFLEINLEIRNIKTLTVSCVGSERSYKTTHFLRHWATELEYNNPLTGYRISGHVTLGKIKEMLCRIPGRILMLTWRTEISDEIKFATESFYFGQKNPQ